MTPTHTHTHTHPVHSPITAVFVLSVKLLGLGEVLQRALDLGDEKGVSSQDMRAKMPENQQTTASQ